MQLFRSNKAEIDFERLEYEFVALQEGAMDGEFGEGTEFIVHNPYGLKIRPEKHEGPASWQTGGYSFRQM